MKTAYRFIKQVPLSGYTPDATGFFEAVAIEGLEGKFIRVSAADQRRYFGRPVFGRRAVRVSKEGKITVKKTQAFGKDFDEWNLLWDSFRSCFSWLDGSAVHCDPVKF